MNTNNEPNHQLTTTNTELSRQELRLARIKTTKLARKKRLAFIRIISILLILISILIGFGIYKVLTMKSDTTPTSTTSETPADALVIQTPEPEQPLTFEDVRPGQNTATAEQHKTNGLAICMYHFVYDASNPPESVDANYIEQGALREEFQYLIDNDYFFPTWEEVRQYIDGELDLPEKSVVLTFDDAAQSFLDLGIPIAEEIGVPITSFVITSWGGAETVENYATPYVTFQSHSHDMHKAGGTIGHGGIFPALSLEDGVADLKASIDVCGNNDAFAYPFGDYTDTCVEALKEAGFLCGVTTEPGRVFPGDNPYLLPRVRMLEGQSLSSFISRVE